MDGNELHSTKNDEVVALKQRIEAYLADGKISEEEEFAVFWAGNKAGLTDAEVTQILADTALEHGLEQKDALVFHLKLWITQFLKNDGIISKEEMFVLSEYAEKAQINSRQLNRLIGQEKRKLARMKAFSLGKGSLFNRLLLTICAASIVVLAWRFMPELNPVGGQQTEVLTPSPKPNPVGEQQKAVLTSPKVIPPASVLPQGTPETIEERPEKLLYSQSRETLTPEDVARQLGAQESIELRTAFSFLKTLYVYLGIPIVVESSSTPLEKVIGEYSDDRSEKSFAAFMENTDVGHLILEACQAYAAYPTMDVFATKYSYELEKLAEMSPDDALAHYIHRIGILEEDIKNRKLPDNGNAMSDVFGLALFARVIYIKAICSALSDNFAFLENESTRNFRVGTFAKTVIPQLYLSQVESAIPRHLAEQKVETPYYMLIHDSGEWGSKEVMKALGGSGWKYALIPYGQYVNPVEYGIIAYSRIQGCDETVFTLPDEIKAFMFIAFMDSYFERHDAIATLIGYDKIADKATRCIDIDAYKARTRFYLSLQGATKRLRSNLDAIVGSPDVPETVISKSQVGSFISAYNRDLDALEKILRVASIDAFLIFDSIKTYALLESARGTFRDDKKLMMDVGREYARLVPLSTNLAVTKSSHKGWQVIEKFLKAELTGFFSIGSYGELQQLSTTQPEWLHEVKSTKQ